MKLTFLGTRGQIEARTRRHRMHSGADVMIDCGRFVLGEELRRFSNTHSSSRSIQRTFISRVSAHDVARESADMILLDDNFASIVAAIEEGRTVYRNIRKFLTYILTPNIPEIVPYLAFVLFRIPLPLTIIQILAVDLGTDMLPALALGTEEPDPDTMKEPPRPRAERLLNPAPLARAYLFLGPMQAGAMAAFFFVLPFGGWHGVTCPAPVIRSSFRPRPRALARSS